MDETLAPKNEMVPQQKSLKFEGTSGLRASIFRTREDLITEVPFPNGIVVAMVDFQPGGKNNLDPENLTQNLVQGAQSLKELFDYFDKNNLSPEYLFGRSNEKMARFVTRLGFEIQRSPHELHGRNSYVMSAKTDVVREKFNTLAEKTDLQGRGFFDQLKKRFEGESESDI